MINVAKAHFILLVLTENTEPGKQLVVPYK